MIIVNTILDYLKRRKEEKILYEMYLKSDATYFLRLEHFDKKVNIVDAKENIDNIIRAEERFKNDSHKDESNNPRS